MSQAQEIIEAKKSGQDAYALAERTAIAKDQDWTFGSTIYVFDDNSRLRFCGPDVEVYTMIDELARGVARKSGYDNENFHELKHDVFQAVCENSDRLLRDGLLATSDDFTSTGTPANGSRAQALYPDFADPTTLGEWEGFDLESVQKSCQDVLNAACVIIEEYENRETK